MILWSAVAPALKSLFSDIALAAAVDPSFQAQWFEAQREFRHPEVQQALTLRVTRVADVHTERRFDYDPDSEGDPPAPTFTETVFGMREFNLEVRVESHDHSEASDSWSWSMLERLRSALFFDRAIRALLDVGVGIVRLSDSRDVSFTFDKRRVNAAMFEATFNAAFSLSDSVPANWFERVVLTSEFQDIAGVTLPSPPNITNVVVPPEDPPPEEPPP